jgi:uncharacterized protein YbjT (DUF2867 family)
MGPVLVTGGTGLLGRAVADRLTHAGHEVRVLSRRAQPAGRWPTVVADLGTGDGLTDSVAGVSAIVHSASDPRAVDAVDVEGTERLLDAARNAGSPHLIYISIVGIDRIPYRYYRAKRAAERAIESSALPWTILRATQFHEFAAFLLAPAARVPLVVPVPKDWRIQPVDHHEVAAQLAAAVDTGPLGRLPDLGGPDIFDFADLARTYLHATGDRRQVVRVPVPGRLSAAYRAGHNLAPHSRGGGRPWSQHLAGITGTNPYLSPVRRSSRHDHDHPLVRAVFGRRRHDRLGQAGPGAEAQHRTR